MDKKLSEVEIQKLKKKERLSEHVNSRFESKQSQSNDGVVWILGDNH